PERCDPRAGGQEQVVVGVAVGRQQEPLAVGARDGDRVALAQVADVVGADAGEQAVVGGVVLVRLRLALGQQALAGGGQDPAVAVLAVAGACDRVEPHLVGLAVGIGARRDDAERLARLPRTLERGARHVDAHVPDERGGLALGAQA
ncbi:MAG: hypothetical protein ACK559_19605, partial [bacterium]